MNAALLVRWMITESLLYHFETAVDLLLCLAVCYVYLNCDNIFAFVLLRNIGSGSCHSSY